MLRTRVARDGRRVVTARTLGIVLATVVAAALAAPPPSAAGGGCCSPRADADQSATSDVGFSEVDIEVLAAAIADAVADDIRRTWDVQCDAPAWNILDSEDAEQIKLTVSNTGDCAFTVKLHKTGGGATEDFPVPAGTPTTINRSNVLKIEIDCTDSPDRCKASYTLTEGATSTPEGEAP
jgi:hypothetical protein